MRIGKCFCRWMLKSSDAKAQDTLRFLKVESNWFLRRNCRRLGGSCYYVAFLRRSRRLLGSHLPLAQARPRRCRPESNLHLRHFPQRRPSRRYFLYPRCLLCCLYRFRSAEDQRCSWCCLYRCRSAERDRRNEGHPLPRCIGLAASYDSDLCRIDFFRFARQVRR